MGHSGTNQSDKDGKTWIKITGEIVVVVVAVVSLDFNTSCSCHRDLYHRHHPPTSNTSDLSQSAYLNYTIASRYVRQYDIETANKATVA